MTSRRRDDALVRSSANQAIYWLFGGLGLRLLPSALSNGPRWCPGARGNYRLEYARSMPRPAVPVSGPGNLTTWPGSSGTPGGRARGAAHFARAAGLGACAGTVRIPALSTPRRCVPRSGTETVGAGRGVNRCLTARPEPAQRESLRRVDFDPVGTSSAPRRGLRRRPGRATGIDAERTTRWRQSRGQLRASLTQPPPPRPARRPGTAWKRTPPPPGRHRRPGRPGRPRQPLLQPSRSSPRRAWFEKVAGPGVRRASSRGTRRIRSTRSSPVTRQQAARRRPAAQRLPVPGPDRLRASFASDLPAGQAAFMAELPDPPGASTPWAERSSEEPPGG